MTEAGRAVPLLQPPRPPPPPPECGLTALTLTAQLLCGDAIHTSALSATCGRQRSARSRGHPRTPSSPEPPVTPEGSPVPISSHCPHPPPPLIPTRSLPAPADAPVLDTSRPWGHVPCGRVCARRPSSRGPCRCLPPSVAAGPPRAGGHRAPVSAPASEHLSSPHSGCCERVGRGGVDGFLPSFRVGVTAARLPPTLPVPFVPSLRPLASASL